MCYSYLLKKKAFRVTLLFQLLVLAGITNTYAQNHPDLFDNWEYNGSFNRDNNLLEHQPYQSTEYTWVNSSVANGLVDGGKLTIGSEANVYNFMHFFNCIGHGATSSSTNAEKRFLIVNGYGGDKDYWHLTNNTPSNKKIIQYQVQNIEPNVFYDLQFWAVHLSDGENPMIPVYYARVDFRIQCNGSNVTTTSGDTHWEPPHTLNTPVWRQSPTFRMSSGDSTQLLIAFYDDCAFTAIMGDDFGIDDVSLRLAPEYNVTAQSFTAPMACLSCEYPTITLQQGSSGHFNTTLPTGAPTTPPVYTAIRKGDTDQWVSTANTVIYTSKGSVYIDANNNLKFHYAPGNNANPGDTDSFQYRITRFGLSASATITIHISDGPSLNTISGFPADGHVCMDALTSFNPSATWNANGSSVTNSGWEWRPSNSSYWHASNTWASNMVSPGNYYIRFYANNHCTTVCGSASISDEMLVRVCNVPVLSSTSISNPSTLYGSNASLPQSYLQQQTPWVNWNNDVGIAQWEVSHNNGATWVPLTGTTLQNNDKLRYHAFNQCGDVVTNSVTISIANGPSFTQSTPTFEDWYCAGATLVMPTPPAFNSNGVPITDQYWAYSADGGVTYTRIIGNPTLTEAWDGRYLCYLLEFNCGGIPSISTSDPLRQLTVYGAPEFMEILPEIGHPFCDGDYLTSSDLQVPPYSGGPDVSIYWEISAGTTPTNFAPFSLPRQLSIADNNKWIRLHAVGCGEAASNAIQIEVNLMTVSAIANPAEGGVVSGSGHYPLDAICTLTASANEGYEFVNWTENGVEVSTNATYSFLVIGNRSLVANFECLAPPTVNQTIELENGWQWISSYVAYDENSLGNLENTISSSTVIAATIKSQTKYRTYEDGNWYGTMSGLENENMYMIQLDQSLTVTFSGPVVNPEDYPITLNKGWNWINFLSPTTLSLENALANLDINVDDVIKGQNGFSTYSGTAWVGSLKNLVPGKGYMYQNMGEENLTLVYPTNAKGSVEENNIELHWKSDPYRFAHNLNMMVSVANLALDEGSHEIGAFVNGKCRGSALIQEMEGKAMAFLTVTGEAGELVSFKVYDVNANKELASVEEHIVFANDALYGNLRQPYMLHLNAKGTNELNSQVIVFPNPTNQYVNIQGHGIERVTLYSLLGQKVLDKPVEGDVVSLGIETLPKGVYLLQVMTKDSLDTMRIVKE